MSWRCPQEKEGQTACPRVSCAPVLARRTESVEEIASARSITERGNAKEFVMGAKQMQDQAWELQPEFKRRILIRDLTSVVYGFPAAYGLMDTREE